jgi:hypothetical protein
MQLDISPQTGVHNPRQYFLLSYSLLLAEEERRTQPGLTESFAKAALLTRCEFSCLFSIVCNKYIYFLLILLESRKATKSSTTGAQNTVCLQARTCE